MITCNEAAAVAGQRHGSHRHVLLWHKLVAAAILPKVPELDRAILIARGKLALVVVDR